MVLKQDRGTALVCPTINVNLGKTAFFAEGQFARLVNSNGTRPQSHSQLRRPPLA